MKGLPFDTIIDAPDLAGKRVMVRASLDVPIENGVVQNEFRVYRSLPTIDFLTEKGAKVIIITHVGREPSESVLPLLPLLQERYHVRYTEFLTGTETKENISSLKSGDVLLLPNLRSDPGEIANDKALAKRLASYADYFVNDAFAVSHREHASIVGIPRYIKSFAGITFTEEYIELSKVLDPILPALFILGGAKFETKEPLVNEYAELYSAVFIGGAIANDFLKAKGYEVGDSLLSNVDLSADPLTKKKSIFLPSDVIVDRNGSSVTVPISEIRESDSIRDVGPLSLEALGKKIKNARTILWNGPLGDYEHGFNKGTLKCAKLIAASDAYTVVGGGDTVASIESLELFDRFSFLSTAGGAMLAFLEKHTLPGVETLKESRRSNRE